MEGLYSVYIDLVRVVDIPKKVLNVSCPRNLVTLICYIVLCNLLHCLRVLFFRNGTF